MKAASFEIDGRESYGLAQGGSLFEASEEFRATYPTLRAVLAGDALDNLAASLSVDAVNPAAMRFLPVIPRADKLLCVGVNYRAHVEEMGREIPEWPVLFVRFPASVVGHGEQIVLPRVSPKFDFEGELAVVIGRPARHVARDAAMDVVAGYCGFMDGTVRDWQRHTPQFTAGKNFDQSGSMGPYLVTPDEVGDINGLELTTRLNGETLQQAPISDLIFDIPALIEYCSTFTELLPGDIIATGTPGGVGAARTPPIWLVPGDSLEVDLGPVGRLVTTVRAE